MNRKKKRLIYVRLDALKNMGYSTVIDEKGLVVKRGKFSNDFEGLEKFMDGLDESLMQ